MLLKSSSIAITILLLTLAARSSYGSSQSFVRPTPSVIDTLKSMGLNQWLTDVTGLRLPTQNEMQKNFNLEVDASVIYLLRDQGFRQDIYQVTVFPSENRIWGHLVASTESTELNTASLLEFDLYVNPISRSYDFRVMDFNSAAAAEGNAPVLEHLRGTYGEASCAEILQPQRDSLQDNDMFSEPEGRQMGDSHNMPGQMGDGQKIPRQPVDKPKRSNQAGEPSPSDGQPR